MKSNKIVHINLMGGLIGLLLTNPPKALRDRIATENNEGWSCIYFLPISDTNLFSIVLKIVVLICTLGLFTWGAGYIVLFERED